MNSPKLYIFSECIHQYNDFIIDFRPETDLLRELKKDDLYKKENSSHHIKCSFSEHIQRI
jgi:hypothetical protein